MRGGSDCGPRLEPPSNPLPARQHLNYTLARRRANQLEQVHLALLYARMGHREAAVRQARAVHVASARMRSEIQCRLTASDIAAAAGQLAEAATGLIESEEFLHRAIECGALIDPWNILGFQGQFSLFPALENSVFDHRAQQLVDITAQLFGLQARVWSEAAAREDEAVAARMEQAMEALAGWWDRYATTTVAGIESFAAGELVPSARHVAAALRAWHRGGERRKCRLLAAARAPFSIAAGLCPGCRGIARKRRI